MVSKSFALSDSRLVELWQLWKHLRDLVPAERTLGDGKPVIRVAVRLDLYGLESHFVITDNISYSDARCAILESTVGVIATADPMFPFGRRAMSALEWELSSDDHAVAELWHQTSAATPFGLANGPLRLLAPIVFALSEDAPVVLSSRPEHRGM